MNKETTERLMEALNNMNSVRTPYNFDALKLRYEAKQKELTRIANMNEHQYASHMLLQRLLETSN